MPRRVFITGGARGIGQAIAQRFQEAGYQIIAPARKDMDLASTDSIENYIDKTGIDCDVLINNAGENKVNPIADISLEDWNRIMTINLTAAFLLTRAAAPKMAARHWGRIVNVSSIYSNLSRVGRAVYSSSKSGLNGLTRTTAIEFGPHNVLANAICPGFVATELTAQNNTPQQIEALAEQTALKRMAQPHEIAEVVYFLGSEINTYLTGQMVTPDGGFSIQ